MKINLIQEPKKVFKQYELMKQLKKKKSKKKAKIKTN